MNRRTATRDRRATSVRATTVVQKYLLPKTDEKDAADKFAAAVVRIDAETLADASGRSVEVARLWKAGKRCPNMASALNMGKVLPQVRAWIEDELGAGVRPASTPQDLGLVLANLQQRCQMPGEEGAMARAMLRILTGGA